MRVNIGPEEEEEEEINYRQMGGVSFLPHLPSFKHMDATLEVSTG